MHSQKAPRGQIFVAGTTLLTSLLVHAAIWAAMSGAPRGPRERPALETLELQVLEARPPEPPRPGPPRPASPAPPRPAPVPPLRLARALPKPQPPLPPPRDLPRGPEPEGRAAPPPIRIGLSLASTASGGAFAMGAGGPLRGRTDEKAADPAEVAPFPDSLSAPRRAGPFVPATRVSTQPQLLGQPSPRYSPEARKAGIEGRVVLALDIDERGNVIGARVVSGLGFGLDEVAVGAARGLRFAPATLDGEAVATQIRFVFTFLLE